MQTATQQLHIFLVACRGNWRNTIYIPSHDGLSGYLMAADPDGSPIIMDAMRFTSMTGEQIDPVECLGHLEEDAFRNIYNRYLTWHFASSEVDVLQELSRQDYHT